MSGSTIVATAPDIALLAPVPLEHLVDGRETVLKEGKVAFGSRAWETFRQLDDLREGKPVDVYIYESHGDGHSDFRVSWRARYIHSVEVQDGAHPDGMKYRPPSTGKYANDNIGHWAVFWELDSLERVPEGERIHVSEFTGYGKKKAYGHAFSPEGLMLIKHP
jgi:hypothetical protein